MEALVPQLKRLVGELPMKSSMSEMRPAASAETGASIVDSFRAITTGVAVIVGGSLVMTTIVGTVAIVGMIARGDNGQTIVSQLTGSFEMALLCAMSGWFMSLIGGYTAGAIAAQACLPHAFLTGAIAMPLSLAVLTVLGDSGPTWLSALSIVLIVPCATLGGWLAAPIETMSVLPELRK